jgi:hypothetical protein
MFKKAIERVKVMIDPPPEATPKVPLSLAYRCWVVMADGRVGYIDHYKSDGRFGVRPIDPKTGKHLLNPSEHWPMEDRERVPEELSLSLKEFRAAESDEIPVMHRR